jgi:hypothetical protein
MFKRTLMPFVAGVLVTLALLASFTAIAQPAALDRITPAVIDIRQSVPVEAVINGAAVPVTVDVALQVSLSGPVTVTARTAHSADTSISSAQPLDYEEVARYTEDHIGETYKFKARVVAAYDYGSLLYVTIEDVKLSYGAALIQYDGDLRLLTNDRVEIVASVNGNTNMLGSEWLEFKAISLQLAD